MTKTARARKIPVRIKYDYTPSLGAVLFSIKGKKPKKTRFTGFEVRPIPKGFSWGKII